MPRPMYGLRNGLRKPSETAPVFIEERSRESRARRLSAAPNTQSSSSVRRACGGVRPRGQPDALARSGRSPGALDHLALDVERHARRRGQREHLHALAVDR